MLILSRKPGEGLVIGGDIRVVVVEVKEDRVRLGVEAPNQAPIARRPSDDSAEAPPREPLRATLDAEQEASIRRLSTAIEQQSGEPVAPEETVGAILDAVVEIELELLQSISLSDLQSRLIEAVRQQQSI